MQLTNFVEDVVALESCHGCGICLAACPVHNCITISKNSINVSKPSIDFGTCIKCNMCVQVCSGFDFENIISEDYGLGDYINIYEGFSLDKKIRKNAASGGIVSAILDYLFENNLIQAAIVADMAITGNYIKAVGKAIYTKNELYKYAKSIYSMVDLSEALNETIKKKINYAIVGLPCHLKSLSKLNDKGSKSKRCILKIGLMDGKNVCSYALDYEINGMNFTKYEFRSKDWWTFKVGRFKENTAECIEWGKSKFSLIWDNFIMMPRRCTVCNDFTAEYSDISVADAWLEKYKGDEVGHSIIISRNEKADRLLRDIAVENLMYLKKSNKECVHNSQYLQIDYKKRLYNLKIKIYQKYFNKYKFVKINYNNKQYNLNDKISMFKHILYNELSLWLINKRLYRKIPSFFLKFNKKFIYQSFVCKVLHKLFKIKNCKYENFKEKNI